MIDRLPATFIPLLPATPMGLVAPPRPPRDPLVDRLDEAALFAGETIVDGAAARACLAGILLLRDACDRAHEACQDLATPEGNYWHGILHRREPDAGNAAYWMRRVGPHPVHPLLAREVGDSCPGPGPLVAGDARLALDGGRWDAGRFVTACCSAGTPRSARDALVSWQAREAILLLAHCARRALGAG